MKLIQGLIRYGMFTAAGREPKSSMATEVISPKADGGPALSEEGESSSSLEAQAPEQRVLDTGVGFLAACGVLRGGRGSSAAKKFCGKASSARTHGHFRPCPDCPRPPGYPI